MSFMKSIGRAVKKVARVVKKVAPVILLAAGIYFGVGAYGAALLSAQGTGAAIGSMTAFKAGMSGIGAKLGIGTSMSGQVTPFSVITKIKGAVSGTTGLWSPASEVPPAAQQGLLSATTTTAKKTMSPLAQAALIQGGTTLAAAALAEEPESRDVKEMGMDGQVINRAGDIRPARMISPNQNMPKVDQTYGAQPSLAQGLIQAKPQVPVTQGPKPEDVARPRGLLRV